MYPRCKKMYCSIAGNRTRVVWVKATYPNRLDYYGLDTFRNFWLDNINVGLLQAVLWSVHNQGQAAFSPAPKSLAELQDKLQTPLNTQWLQVRSCIPDHITKTRQGLQHAIPLIVALQYMLRQRNMQT